ncbi:MAG: alpha-galactosidase [Candidatus Limivivens sp.]|nr:alpha-galactosidase [Candidatus Limivivens sp.]
MAILLNESRNLFTLQTAHTMYQMKADDCGVLLHTYYGKRTPVCDYSYLITYADHGFSGNPYEKGNDRTYSLDALPQEYPVFGSGDYRESALKVRFGDGTTACELRYEGFELAEGKYGIPGLPAIYATEDTKADTLVLKLLDTTGQIRVSLFYGVLEDLDLITRAVKVENLSKKTIALERVLSTCVDFLRDGYEMEIFYGRHAKERTPQRMPLGHGSQVIGSTRGASSHQYNPFFVICDSDTMEEAGSCYGFSFLYSGDFYGAAGVDQYDQTRVVLGIHPENFSWRLEPGESFYAPEAAMVYSEAGLETLSQRYHTAYRHNLCRGKYKTARRPVLLNSWEGVYFDFDGDKLVRMAREAAELGAELFVMDDGWFGKRDGDSSGLGDWTVNEQKLGCSLAELSERIHALGLQFGIWFEPECVSEDSDLYRAHPDWALQVPGKRPVRSRYQLVLDFSRKEVRDGIFEQMCQVLDHAKIEYVKWDFNRSISDLYSAALPADRQGETAHRYVLGLYEVLERLLERYPDLLVEGCSGGGGRFDAGMLYYTPQIWCSDDTDAVERLTIQYGTSFCYPVSTVGSHVSRCPNEQTGRNTPLETRATVAMAGTFGYELDVNRMSPEEKEAVKGQIQEFRNYEELIRDGRYYRLTHPGKNRGVHAWEFASEDGSEALVCAVALQMRPNGQTELLKVRGLKADTLYEMNGKTYYGGALMEAGIPVPMAKVEYESFRFHFVERA